MRAKLAFINCRISQEETAINFLSRLEQKANEARNFDMRITEKKFIWILLNNMKHHRFYKERIASFLTTFELNPSSISQKWIENKFYSLDEDRIISFKNRFRENARFSQEFNMKSKQQPSSNTIRCKYCYRKGHSDNNCQDKANKRPPSMPEWISKATCAKCKKKGHLAFNCPPKYGNKIVKSSKFSKKKGPNKIESADHVTEFAGMVYHTDREKKNLSFDMNYIFDKRKDDLLTLLVGHNREVAKRIFYYNSKNSHHMQDLINTNIRRLCYNDKITVLWILSLMKAMKGNKSQSIIQEFSPRHCRSQDHINCQNINPPC